MSNRDPDQLTIPGEENWLRRKYEVIVLIGDTETGDVVHEGRVYRDTAPQIKNVFTKVIHKINQKRNGR